MPDGFARAALRGETLGVYSESSYIRRAESGLDARLGNRESA